MNSEKTLASYNRLKELILSFEAEIENPELRAKVLGLVSVARELRNLGGLLIPRDLADSGRDRILVYFRKYARQIISGDELMVVSGIRDYPRRVRELRVEFGWNILSGGIVTEMIAAGDLPIKLESENLTAMGIDDYLLIDDKQDRDAALRWNIANKIRNLPIGVKEKVLEFFRQNVGRKISGEELSYIARGKGDWPRRVRELRAEEGWPIITRNTGDPTMPSGVYMLVEDRQSEPHDRMIPDEVRIEVLTRDGFQCANPACGWSVQMRRLEDPRQFLELHHIVHFIKGGSANADNLTTLCNVCHDRVHAGRLEITWIETHG